MIKPYLFVLPLLVLTLLFGHSLAGQVRTASDSNSGPLIVETAADSSEIQIEKLRIIRERLGPVAAFVDRNGLITGFRNLMIGSNDRQDLIGRIYAFLEQNIDIFGLTNPRVELPITRNRYAVIESKQVASGLDIINSGFHIVMGQDNRFIEVMECNIYPNAQSLNTTPSIDSLEAFGIALNDPAHEGRAAVTTEAELKIAYVAGSLHLIWHFFLQGGGYNGGSEYYIDAHNGAILRAVTAVKY